MRVKGLLLSSLCDDGRYVILKSSVLLSIVGLSAVDKMHSLELKVAGALAFT